MKYYNKLFTEGFSKQRIYQMLYEIAFNNMNYSEEELFSAAKQILQEEFSIIMKDDSVYLCPYSPYIGEIELCDSLSYSDFSEDDAVNSFIEIFDFAKIPSFGEYFERPPIIVHRLSDDKRIIIYSTYSDILNKYGSVTDQTLQLTKAYLQEVEAESLLA